MHVRCPHCHNAIEIVGDSELTDVTCPSCGSSFNLLPDTESYTPSTRSIGHFQLLEQIGAGGFGTVWKAKDKQLDRLVAVKIPRRDQVAPEDAEMFLREARAAAQLKHPSIVAVHEVGRENGSLYIVSDFVQGVTLADRLTAGPYPVREAAELLAQIAEGLHHAHEAGVIHRDLKPQNIMLDAAGQPHIMDFGLAKREAGEITMTVEGKVLGTAAYMSPQQARGEAHAVDRRTDVYSLGVILFQLLTGELPFRGNRAMLLNQVLYDEPPSPRKLYSRISRDLETITLKCLEKDPSRRYATAAELAAELKRWLANEPIIARPVSSAERAIRWARRNPTIAGLSSAIVLVLLAGLIVSTLFGIAATQQAKRADTESSKAKSEAEKATGESKRAIRNYYDSQMNLAQRDWEVSDIGNLIRRLESTKPEHTGRIDLRGFEWHYWNRLSRCYKMSLGGHTGPVRCVAFSPDGNYLASTYDSPFGSQSDVLVRVWDAVSGRAILEIKGHTSTVSCVAFSPDGMRLATTGHDAIVKVWDTSSGKMLLELPVDSSDLLSVAFSGDGKLLAAGGDERLAVWDANSGELLREDDKDNGLVFSVAFSRDGARLAYVSLSYLRSNTSGQITVLDANSWKELRTIEGRYRCVTFSPDGQRLAATDAHGLVKVWDANSGELLHTLHGHTHLVGGVTFAPEGKRLASASADRTIKVWDSASGELRHTLKGHTAEVTSVSFAPGGERLASASYDGTVKIWDARSDEESIVVRGPDFSVSDEMDGRLPFEPVTMSPDASRVASFVSSHSDTVRVWDAMSGKSLFTLRGKANAAFSGDSKRLATASGDGTITVWDATNGDTSLKLKGHSRPAQIISFSADGKRLASATRFDFAANVPGEIKVWDAICGDLLLTLDDMEWVTSAAISPDGKRLAAALLPAQRTEGGGDVRVWDATSGELLYTLNGQAPYYVAFSPDGKRFAIASRDRTITVWEAMSGKLLLTLRGHASAVLGVSFSADGQRLASASTDRTVKLWDALNGEELLTLKGHAAFRESVSIAFNTDSRRLAVASTDHKVIIWDATPRDVQPMSKP